MAGVEVDPERARAALARLDGLARELSALAELTRAVTLDDRHLPGATRRGAELAVALQRDGADLLRATGELRRYVEAVTEQDAAAAREFRPRPVSRLAAVLDPGGPH